MKSLLSKVVVTACSTACLCGGTIAPQIIARTGDSTTAGDLISQIDPEGVSINDHGHLGLLANVSGNGTGQCLIAADVDASGAVTLRKFSFASPSSTRTYLGSWRTNDGLIGSRDRLSGSSPAFLARLWNPDGFTTLVSTTTSSFNFVTTTAFARNGSHYAFVGSQGFNALYLQPPGAFPEIAGSVSGGGFRPMTANDGSTVIRTENNTLIRVFSPFAPPTTVSPTGLLNPAAAPGISGDGINTAFLGEFEGVTGIYANLGGSVFHITRPAPPPVAPEQPIVGPFQTWRDSDKNGQVTSNEIFGGLASFQSGFSRIGIATLDKPLGNQVMVVFVATDVNGHAGVHYARLDWETGRVFATARVARAGQAIGGFTPTSFFLADPVNHRGQIAFQASDGSTSAAMRHNATTFTKYKQNILRGTADTIPMAANRATRWFDQPVNPKLKKDNQQRMSAVGCFLTSAAMISGIYGQEITPLEMRDKMLAIEAIDSKNSTTLLNLRVEGQDGILVRDPATDGGNFDSIAAHLRTGHPVLLAVPIKGSTNVSGDKIPRIDEFGKPVKDAKDKQIIDFFPHPPRADDTYLANGNRHYIIAYGLDSSLAPGATATAAHIHIADPAYISPYRTRHGASYDAAEELVNITLQDYFDVINNNPKFSFNAREWFDHSTFTNKSDGFKVVVANYDRKRQIQRFKIVENPPPPNPTASVHSPIELRVTIAGVSYVSDAAFAQPGDILLPKEPVDVIAEFDPDEETGIMSEGGSDTHPPYLLVFPPETAGLPMDVEVHGVGDGPYSVDFASGIPNLLATNSLEGDATSGLLIRETVEFAIPEPSVPLPKLRIERMGDEVRLVLAETTPGIQYQLQRSTILGQWPGVGAPVPGQGSDIEWTEPILPGWALYRVELTSP